MPTEHTEADYLDWHACYDSGWKDLIVPAAFAHPAKYAHGLIVRIITHGIVQGFWKPGDLIGDPFGGIGTGGIVATYYGLRWVGVELEPRFHALALENFALHRPRWKALGEAEPIILCGDSRRFAELVQCEGVVTSPPFATAQEGGGIAQTGTPAQRKTGNLNNASGTGGYRMDMQGDTPGQIGSLPAGQLDAALTSPPYAESLNSAQHGIKDERRARDPEDIQAASYGTTSGQIGALKSDDLDAAITSPPYAETSIRNDANYSAEKLEAAKAEGKTAQRATWGNNKGSAGQDGYGSEPGNIGNLKDGGVDGVVTSPPYEALTTSGGNTETERKRMARKVEAGEMDAVSMRKMTAPHSQMSLDPYGQTDGQLGNASGETYWQAMAQVYRQMWLALKPGGVAAIVVKDYVKDKARVPLCDQTVTLLESLGFVVFQRARAWLVKETNHVGLFGNVSKKKERKSFFRRLAEKKGSPAIDFEEVIFARRQ